MRKRRKQKQCILTTIAISGRRLAEVPLEKGAEEAMTFYNFVFWDRCFVIRNETKLLDQKPKITFQEHLSGLISRQTPKTGKL